jgi:hypothetical protein
VPISDLGSRIADFVLVCFPDEHNPKLNKKSFHSIRNPKSHIPNKKWRAPEPAEVALGKAELR